MTNDEKIRRAQEIDDLKSVMKTVQGRRFIWRMLGEAGVFRQSFVGGDALATAFNEGSRNRGLALLGEIMSELPESYLLMQKEAVNNEQIQKELSRNKRRPKAGRDAGGGDSDN